jgi:hypothetical protein
MLRARLSRFHDELVHALRVVAHVFTAAEAINREPYGLVKRSRIQFDGVLNSIGILERHPAPFHGCKDITFRLLFAPSTGHIQRRFVLPEAHIT